MDHYAADENYFTEEGLQKGHDDLVRKLEEKKKAHVQHKAERRQRAVAQAERSAQRRRWSILLVVLIVLAGVVGGWYLSTFMIMS